MSANRETNINIPFVDDEESFEILSDSEECLQKFQQSISQRKGANLRIIIDAMDSDGETEKLDKPGPLISDLTKSVLDAPMLGLRRNSFSMPALNENDLDALRALHSSSLNDEEDLDVTEKSEESLNGIQVSTYVCKNFT